ncbi:MAG: hypothetical protein KAT11_00820 [Phycisphaerae bacterium]|nr:hypothetical protein [Phycisphaerae bacterium]
MAKESSMSKYLLLAGRFALLAIASAGLGAAIGLAVVLFRDDRQLHAIGVLALGLAAAGLLLSLAAIVTLLYRILEHHRAQLDAWHISQDSQRRLEGLLQQISENVLISDAAKEVVYRSRDRELMKNAIQEDIDQQDWEAAYRLLEQMQSRFGYSREAAQFRRLVDSQRSRAIKAVIEETRLQVDSLCAAANWNEAQALLDNLAEQFPSSSEAKRMAQQTVSQKRTEHKDRLLADWNQAVEDEQIDRGIMLLQELDEYLSPAEAVDLKESAREVFRAKLQNLGADFSVAVSEKKWNQALQIGQEIITDFPNSRMAEEVKGKFEILEQRAREQAEV